MNLLPLLILGMLWGSSPLLIKITVAEVPPLTLAAVVMWAVLRARGLSMPRNRRVWGAYAVIALLHAVLPHFLIAWGTQYISSGMTALLGATIPIFTVLLARFLIVYEQISLAKMVGVVIGFVGVSLVILPDLRPELQANLLGQLAIVGASLSFAVSTIYTRSRFKGQPPLVSATGHLTLAALFSLLVSLFIERPFDLLPSLPTLAAWLGLGLLMTLSLSLYFALIKRTSAPFVSMATYIMPITGCMLGVLVLKESLTGVMLTSLALILLGVMLVNGTWPLIWKPACQMDMGKMKKSVTLRGNKILVKVIM